VITQPVYRRRKGAEQVIIPLGQARYEVQTSWDRTVVVISGASHLRKRAWSRTIKGKVVGRLVLSPLVWGIVRVVVELNQPATPEIQVGQSQHDDSSLLLLTYRR
jgi:hypothetical protein